jgi:hypothetical protein
MYTTGLCPVVVTVKQYALPHADLCGVPKPMHGDLGTGASEAPEDL